MGYYQAFYSEASLPGMLPMSKEKYRQIVKDILKVDAIHLYEVIGNFPFFNENFIYGDTQPAIVVSLSPLVISAYSDELDAVLFLKFPEDLGRTYKLHRGMRLTAANTYPDAKSVPKDIFPGQNYNSQFKDFTPMIHLFFSYDDERALALTSHFDEDVWAYVERLTAERENKRCKPRDGFYFMMPEKKKFSIF